MDYNKLGFKAGLEIHQQLEGKKLFCSCPTIITDKEPDYIIKRRLRASAGESGEIDIAAKHEQKIGKEFIYHVFNECNCLVDIDEEPPHEVNRDAINIALQVSLLLNAKVVDELHFMRKTVIDGSNTSAFQRTGLIARDGFIETSKGNVKILTVCLEEEAAKIVSKNDSQVIYNLSRLGIPLIEVATAPDIKDPEHAKEVAEKIGMILRSINGIKRGIGTIRQDINVSITNGARIELKGFQELRYIPSVIQNEIERQLKLIEKKEKVKSEVRNAKSDGTSEFLRPMPGAERMYPETDISTIQITKELLSKIKLPELLTEKIMNLEKKYNINSDLAKEILKRNINVDKFLIGNLEPNFVVKVLIEIPKEIKTRFELDITKLKDSDYLQVLTEINKGIPKTAAIEMLIDIIKNGKLDSSKYKLTSDKDLEQDIKTIIENNKGASLNALIGEIMKKYRGKVDGKKVVELIKKLS
ncbi:MAG: Glu-tRNA(Gln) amidotransferase subunit GatE [Candidatus Nanoarchaeia archaeon]|nr:Glu-tRNA(Gln) amidotransferase subunit GatE [Candidatus Nanoarchaeia archaeon]